MLHLKMLELHVETLTVWAGSHHAYLNRSIVLHPGIAHHGVSLVIERIEDLDGIQSAHSLDPDVWHGLVEGYHAPVAGLVSHHGAEVVLAIHIFDARLDVISFGYLNLMFYFCKVREADASVQY